MTLGLDSWRHPVLFGTGFAAGFVDSIAGGGGLLTLPVLLHLGFSPQAALATNKLQACFGSGSAAWHYSRAGWVRWPEVRLGIAVTFAAAALGAWIARQSSPDLLRRLIPLLLAAIALYLLLRPAAGLSPRPARWPLAPFSIVFGSLLGFYDGFFGPGTGTFWAMACVGFIGLDLARATAHTKIMNLASNLAALLVFLPAGQTDLPAGILMGAGQWCGAWAGSRWVVRKGVSLIRPVFIAAVLALASKLLLDNFLH